MRNTRHILMATTTPFNASQSLQEAATPNGWSNHYRRGTSNERMGRYTAAIIEFSKAIEIKHRNPELFYRRALARYAVDDYERAIDDLNSALRITPADKRLQRTRRVILDELYPEPDESERQGLSESVDTELPWHWEPACDPILPLGEDWSCPDSYFALMKELCIQGSSMPETADQFYFHGFSPLANDCRWENSPEPDAEEELHFDLDDRLAGLRRAKSPVEPSKRQLSESFDQEGLGLEGLPAQEEKQDGDFPYQREWDPLCNAPPLIRMADSNMKDVLLHKEEIKKESKSGISDMGRNTMTISCLSCGKREFHINPADVETAKVITFVCPECGEYTAVSERKGGGIIVAVDDHSKGESPSEEKSRANPI
jgi:hypothetical protein